MKIVVYAGGTPPTRAHEGDAGLDLYSPIDIIIPGKDAGIIDTLVAVEIPEGFFGDIRSRSSLMKKGITTDGTIDSNYRGHIRIVLFNHSCKAYEVHAGDRIAQMVIEPYRADKIEIVSELSETDRNTGGFGSTGK